MRQDAMRMRTDQHQGREVHLRPFVFIRRFRPLARGLREAALIAGCAMLPALALYGYSRVKPEHKPIMQAVSTDALWIDARSEADFAHEHVPGALNLNEHNWDDALARVFETWQPPRPIVVYCSAGCPAGAKIAARLTELGIEPIRVFEGGFEKWKQSNS